MPRISKNFPERVDSNFIAIPFKVLDSEAYRGAAYAARSLLIELARQLNGRNNGHLQLSARWLKGRGWNSDDVVQRAKNQLVERGLIALTRQGGLCMGANLYAVTWLQISNYIGLDITQRTYHQGAWSLLDRPPVLMPSRGLSSARESSSTPSTGTGSSVPIPANGAISPQYPTVLDPADGNNVVTTINQINESPGHESSIKPDVEQSTGGKKEA